MQSGRAMKEADQDKSSVGYAFSLFEFAHLLRVRPRIWPQSSSTSKQQDVQLLPFIQSVVWSESEDSCLLVLLCSNDTLLLWSCCPTGSPVMKQISWFQNPVRVIRALALDPTGSWLACACMDTHIYIVPVGAVVKGNDSSLNTSAWPSDDITRLQTNARRGLPSSIVWWHTVDDFHICIVGTEFGEVIFLDVKAGGVVASADVKESIISLELLQDKEHETTALMITAVSGEAWQMLLEYKAVRKASFSQIVSPSVAYAMGFEMVGKVAMPIGFVFSSSGDLQERLKPMPVQSISGDLQFSVQYARNQVFIGVHDQRTDVLEVYDMEVEHLPIFVYQLPVHTSDVLLTDRLIFAISHQDHDKTRLFVLSSQLAETSLSAPQTHQKADISIIQSFVLPPDEKVIAMFKRKKYLDRSGHCQSADFVLPPTAAEQDVMDGAIIVTTSGVYECRLRVSPEELFLDLAVHQADTSTADILAITIGLDVNSLYEKAADESLGMGKYEHALKLYQLSKCPFSRRVAQFAKHGRVADILGYLRQVLSKHSDVHTAERKQLSNLAFSCFVQQILESTGDKCRQQELNEAFSQFINDNFDYDEFSALELLCNYGLKDLMFGVAKARGLMAETLELLAQKGMFHLSTDLQTKLATRGFTDIISRSSNGAFVKCMDPEDAVRLLLVKPETILSHVQFLRLHLLSLGEDSLVHIARVLDPSRPSFKSLAAKLKSGLRQRTESGSSISSTISIESTVSFGQEESKRPSLTDLVQLFLCTLIVLNHRRKPRNNLPPRIMLKTVSGAQENSRETCRWKRGGTVDGLCKPVKLSCGQQHTAVLSAAGDVYTWGKSQKGRLGHGDLIEDEGKSVPFRVEILHMHRVKVVSVACGLEHTLALCVDGVYAWGSSEYGQLGQGDTRKHTRPVYVTELSDKRCTAVACGHYHSLALSADFRVWTWGWGVHGQLGLGGIEDILLPSHVTALDFREVTLLAAGYSHSAVLTSQGLVMTFGGGLYGQLGLGATGKQSTPRVVELLKNKKVYIICCGSFETVAVTEDQEVYSWGRSPNYLRSHMRLESRSRRPSPVVIGMPHRLVPVKMKFRFPSQLEQICCGNLHFAALTASGKVYTWGYNDSGQLGHKKRESRVVPGLVKKLSEIEVASISVGAEFSVAMDTGGRVWVWGRADSGQLGLDASCISSAGKKEVPVPNLLTSLPLMNLKPPCTLEKCVSAAETSAVFDLDLPNLSSVGSKNNPYGRESLAVALLMLKKYYPAQAMIRHCMDIKDYLSASVIYENLDQWAQVAHCQLTFLSWCKRNNAVSEDLELLESAMDVLQYVTRKYLNSPSEKDVAKQHTLWLLQEVLFFWQFHQLPVSSLESFFLEHLCSLAYPLSLIFIRDPVVCASYRRKGGSVSAQMSNTEPDAAKRDSPPYSHLQFSTEFLTKVTDVVTQQVAEEFKGAEYEADLTCWSRSDEHDVDNEASSDTSELIIGVSNEISGVQKRLWQEILDNIKKDVEKQGHIALSMTTAATIAAAALSQQRESRQDGEAVNHSDADVVVFTCNHHFPRVYFVDVILPEFQHHMSELVFPLANTTKLLLRFYSKLSDCLPTACPICVYNSVRMEQLALASNHGGEWSERSKPWEI